MAAAATLAAPAAAIGAARFASPTGTGTACTSAAPCDVVTAVNNAASGDDVTIEPGSYSVTTTLDDGGHTLTIHGRAGAPRPMITNSMTNGIQLMGPASSASYLELHITSKSGAGIGTTDRQTIDRVIVNVTNTEDTSPACTATSTMTDSVCWTAATNGIAAFNGNNGVTATATLRNDTLEATGTGGTAVYAQGFGSGASPTIALLNSIARGAGEDVLASNLNGTSATVTADHSNFATSMASGAGASAPSAGSGSNQTAAPQFVNATAGDFHEARSSPTIDTGADSPLNGSLDAAGLPRTMGTHTDIGAFEYPVPVCQPLNAATPFADALAVQLTCADPSGAAITSYTIVAFPTHGTISLNVPKGSVTYIPSSGFSGTDAFGFEATSANGTGAPATATINVGTPLSAQPAPKPAPTVPQDSQPRLSAAKFKACTRGAPIARACGTFISYTDSQAATTTFTVQGATAGVLSHGRCVKRPHKRKGKAHSRSCNRYVAVGSFKHSDKAGANRFHFTGRLSGHKLKPGRYRLISTPINAQGQSGATHNNNFSVIR
jgi:hypothetical protein